MRFLQAIAILVLVLRVGVSAPLQNPQPARGDHQVQISISLPSGVTSPTIIVTIESDRGFRKSQTVTGETFIEFTQIPNGDYTITLTPDKESQVEPYTERFSIQARFSQVRRLTILMRSKAVATGHVQPGTVNATRAEIPKSARKAFERGIEKSQKGKSDEAIKAFQEALGYYPDYFDAMNNLAVEYIKLDRCNEAITLLERAIKIEPSSPQPHINFGIALNKEKRYSDAIDELSQAIRLDFNNPLAHFQLGIACFLNKELMRARLEFEITTESKKIPLSRLYLADVYKQEGRTGDAINQIETFLREAPDNQHAEAARKELSELKNAK